MTTDASPTVFHVMGPTSWIASTQIPPLHAVAFDKISGAYKIGDGVTPFEDLPYPAVVTTITLGNGAAPQTIGDTSSTLVAQNPNRKFLMWEVLSGDVTITSGGADAVWGQGFIYSAGAAGEQGGGETFDTVVPTDAFQAICATGQTATIVVWQA